MFSLSTLLDRVINMKQVYDKRCNNMYKKMPKLPSLLFVSLLVYYSAIAANAINR